LENGVKYQFVSQSSGKGSLSSSSTIILPNWIVEEDNDFLEAAKPYTQ